MRSTREADVAEKTRLPNHVPYSGTMLHPAMKLRMDSPVSVLTSVHERRAWTPHSGTLEAA